jgi:hypothetical protein
MEHNKKTGLLWIENAVDARKAYEAGEDGLGGTETGTVRLQDQKDFPIGLGPISTMAVIKGVNKLAGEENPPYDSFTRKALTYLENEGISLTIT